MTNAKPTPGAWRVEEGTTLVWGECNAGDATNYGMGYPIAECQITPSGKWAKGPSADEGAANARLIAEAGTVYHETGLTPRQLAEQRNALVEALEPFAACADQIATDEDGEEWAKFRLLIKHYRAATQAIARAKGEK